MIEAQIERALGKQAQLVAFPELVVTGYPPEDLLLRNQFIEENLSCVEAIAQSVRGLVAVVGFVDRDAKGLYNAAAVLADGEIKDIYRKQVLPNYGVFDERRYFEPGESALLGRLNETVFGVTICEDLWAENGPYMACVAQRADVLINLNASPYHIGKSAQRHDLLSNRARDNAIAICYVNLVGGQDELVFDGQSCGYGANGDLLASAARFSPELLIVDLPSAGLRADGASSGADASKKGPVNKTLRFISSTEGSGMHLGEPPPGTLPELQAPSIAPELALEEEVYAALVLGLTDYAGKNGFTEALVGLSGGIDSALTAAIAADALGGSCVLGVSNPSRFTSAQSKQDAELLANRLGISLVELPIQDGFNVLLDTLNPVFENAEWDVAEENLQARIRGALWMAISNKTGRLVLSTGNKSELSVGYSTLYGDLAGGFAVLKDVSKTLVYRLARWRNESGEVIPPSIIARPPTAELRPDQLDTDSLPPYEVLDPILESYVEKDLSIKEIVGMGFTDQVVRRVTGLVDRAEYKRRQSPPGIKVTERAFGRDRRLPITNHYRPYL